MACLPPLYYPPRNLGREMINSKLCKSSIGATAFIWWLPPSTAATFINGQRSHVLSRLVAAAPTHAI